MIFASTSIEPMIAVQLHYQDIGSALTLAVLAAKASVIQTIFLE